MRPPPVTYVQSGMFAFLGDSSHKDGVGLCAQLVREHLREGRRDGQRAEQMVEKAVGRLRPFQEDIRPAMLMKGEETAVQLAAVGLEHAHPHVDTGVAQLPNAPALHLRKGIDATHDDARHTLAEDEVGTGRRLALMRAGLETHVERGLRQQDFVFGTNGGKGIHLGVGFATTYMVALTQDSPLADDHRAHHRIGFGREQRVGGQRQAAAHPSLVVLIGGRFRLAVDRGCGIEKIGSFPLAIDCRSLTPYAEGSPANRRGPSAAIGDGGWGGARRTSGQLGFAFSHFSFYFCRYDLS